MNDYWVMQSLYNDSRIVGETLQMENNELKKQLEILQKEFAALKSENSNLKQNIEELHLLGEKYNNLADHCSYL